MASRPSSVLRCSQDARSRDLCSSHRLPLKSATAIRLASYVKDLLGRRATLASCDLIPKALLNETRTRVASWGSGRAARLPTASRQDLDSQITPTRPLSSCPTHTTHHFIGGEARSALCCGRRLANRLAIVATSAAKKRQAVPVTTDCARGVDSTATCRSGRLSISRRKRDTAVRPAPCALRRLKAFRWAFPFFFGQEVVARL